MLPTFIFIGPSKCGSTWIYEALRLHPEVCVAKAKDIYFFDKYFNKGLAWYKRQFSHCCCTHKAIGEFSHDYLFSEEACYRIYKTIPHVKLITCLRNPVERAFSTYLFLIKHGLRFDFFTALNKIPEIIQHSCYAEPLKKYITTFGREQILILRFEYLKNDPLSFISKIYKFIGVNPYYQPKEILFRKILPASKPRNRLLAYVMKQLAIGIRNMGYPNIVGTFKRSSFIQKLLYTPYKENERPLLSEYEKKYLQEIFEPHIIALEKLLNEDFSDWRN